MKTGTATYVAPFGDSKVTEMGGVTFFDGKPVEINSYDHPHLIEKLQANQHFDVTVGEDDKKPAPAAKKRGRPSAKDIAEAKALAEQTEADAKAAAAKAKEAKADVDAIQKSDKATPAQQQAVQLGGQPKTEPVT
jgi:hypothetical protein